MDREQGRRYAGCEAGLDRALDRLVVGSEIARDAFFALFGLELPVAGDDGAIRQTHDESGIVLAAIEVDQQPGIVRHHGRHSKPRRERAGDAGSADIVGDVAAQLLGREAKGAVPAGKSVGCVVAQQQKAGSRTASQDRVRFRRLVLDDRRLRRSGMVLHDARL